MSDDSWSVNLSDEVREWYDSLSVSGLAQATRAIVLLSQFGPMLRMPHAKHLRTGLWELRFTCENVDRRITHILEQEHQVITLTTFRKQRQRESREIERARNVQARYLDREGRQQR